MAAVDDLRRLIDRAHRELEDWHDFFEHTKVVWRTFQIWVTAGHTLRAQNAVTHKEFTEADLTSLSQYYITFFLAPVVLQRLTAAFETYVFGVLEILLRKNPGCLDAKPISLGELLKKGSIEAVIDEAIQRKLNDLRFDRPSRWFEFLNTVERLGCPSEDEIASIAEMKATRDVIEHNNGFANAIYVEKAGRKGRFNEGEPIDVSDEYLRDCWRLLRNVCSKTGEAAIRVMTVKA
jgi:hypothetical protein